MRYKFQVIYSKIQKGGTLDGMILTGQCRFVTRVDAEQFLAVIRERFEVTESKIVEL
jgi:hypothetical protein